MSIVVCKFYENTLILYAQSNVLYTGKFCVILFLRILRILKFRKNNYLLMQKIIMHVSCMCTRGNQLNGHGQEAG